MHLVVNTDEHIKERKACREGLNCYLTYELVVAQFRVKRKTLLIFTTQICPTLKAMKNGLVAF